MQIDWFTFVAQIVNFLILVGLLKYFLYDRIINMINERQERIASRLHEAESREQDAQQEKEKLESERKDFEQKEQQKLQALEDEIKEKKKAELDNVRKEIDEKKQQWQKALEDQQKEFVRDLKNRIGKQAVQISEKLLADLANEELEARMLDRFLDKVDEIDWRKAGKKTIVVRSSFDPDKEKKDQLTSKLERDVEFKTSKELICGIELQVGDQVVSWGIKPYLSELDETYRELTSEQK
jgi:F-type H+-transporting ATPase subunit b